MTARERRADIASEVRQMWDCRQFVGLCASSRSRAAVEKEDLGRKITGRTEREREREREKGGEGRRRERKESRTEVGKGAKAGGTEDGRHKATIFSRLLTFQHYLELEYRELTCSRGKSSFVGQEDVFPPQRRDSGFIWNFGIPLAAKRTGCRGPTVKKEFQLGEFPERSEEPAIRTQRAHVRAMKFKYETSSARKNDRRSPRQAQGDATLPLFSNARESRGGVIVEPFHFYRSINFTIPSQLHDACYMCARVCAQRALTK